MDPNEVGQRAGERPSQPVRVLKGQGRDREVNDNPPIPVDDILLARAIALAFQNLARTTAPQVAPQPAIQPQKTEIERNLRYLIQFDKLMKVTFEGGPDPLVVDVWLDEVEKHFKAIVVPDDRLKITLATYIFVSDAAIWWKTMTSAHDIDSISWDAFKSLFFNKYFLQTKRRELRTQFDGLEQGDMPVTEYENKFTSFSCFAMDVLGNEEEKTWRFVYGLNRFIRPGVTLLGLKRYSEAITRALMAEAEAKDWQVRCGIVGPQERGTSMGTFSGNQDKKRHGRASVLSQEQRMAGTTPIVGASLGSSRASVVCYDCRQPGHSKAECHLDQPSFKVYFWCDQLDHIKRDCPQRR
ncbi:uncharacterized protein LOC132272640 [Cornus florida]|uniref:uncharacterized protein LOC132272640 n=1 Tax=Cornus florida TaxID=4283 RepID=UPI0028A15E37|nr:uncharacterized protein LOC132272640 [Cornus florida]